VLYATLQAGGCKETFLGVCVPSFSLAFESPSTDEDAQAGAYIAAPEILHGAMTFHTDCTGCQKLEIRPINHADDAGKAVIS
jgi:hypothetical protein